MGDGFRDFFYTSADGLTLHARLYGEPQRERLPVVCLPGLTRNARDFHALAGLLAHDEKAPRRVIVFEYRGRGLSEYDRNWRNYNVATEAADISAGLTVLGIEHAAFIGTSRGGLIIMTLAAMRPAVLKAAVLNDVGPVLERAGLAHIRSYLENAPKPGSIEDAVRLQKAVNGQAFSALSEEDWERQTRALYHVHADQLTADYDPRLLETLKQIDLSLPLPAIWPQFEGLKGIPVLAIRGVHSLLLSQETFAEMACRHPDLDAVSVDGQGHAPLLETGDLPSRVAALLARADRVAKR